MPSFALLLMALGLTSPARAKDEPIRLQVVGGLGGVTQFTRLEQPFWEREIPERTGGRVVATIIPNDSGGLRGQEMLQLMRLGVVPFGTGLLSVVSAEEPELNAVDLAILNPDMATLKKTVAAFRAHLVNILRDRWDIELLAIYAYPAQVLFCRSAFRGLDDIAGRRVRTSSVAQSDLMKALGAIPVVVPFADVVDAVRQGVVDCAITGTLSGYEIGLGDVTTHVHSMAISWGISFFGANLTAWQALPQDVRAPIRDGLADLEGRIWQQAESDTARGLDCNTGASVCGRPQAHRLVVVPQSEADAARRLSLLSGTVLPRWIERCGSACVDAWNAYLAKLHTTTAKAE
ncbi:MULTISPECIES: TRAP transporter substrate-binding protein [Xanthobacter]|uniref:TRAP transporter substrate-binding protein n=1 Tax=Xanthobacter TaxID=279 RepID=UPI001E644EDF|nr:MULTISPECIES: TRAP transporter substrate-binding protein [Xanthobacter]UDQ91341.1 TRAP transporter substrate-binding protein [Xanthobacter autotrophicus]